MSAARRITASAVDWAAFAKRVPKVEENEFRAFRLKCDGFLKNIERHPAELQKINWDHYASRITIPGMVDDFKKKYEALQVPYPKDSYTNAVNDKEKQEMGKMKKAVQESNARITKHQEELERWKNILPFAEMTLEEFVEEYPDLAKFNMDKPSLWPHNPECQPGYVPPEGEAEEHH